MDIARWLDRWPNLWRELDRSITLHRAASVFARLGDTYAPSQVARHTRGRVLREMLEAEPDRRAGLIGCDANLWTTGTVAVHVGSGHRKPVWLIAHLDAISYAVQRKESDRFRLIPLCYHQITHGRRPARALHYSLQTRTMETFAVGEIVTEDSGQRVYFETDAVELPGDARIVYETQTRVDWDTLMVEGNIDNAFACAALYLASVCLGTLRASDTHAAPEVLAAFPDEEEGVTSAGNQAFCKGSMRLFHRTPLDRLPDLVVVSDVQEAEDMADGPGAGRQGMGQGATFAGVSSLGKGGVVPPPLLAFQRSLATFLRREGVLLRENTGGYLSRSDDVSAMLYTPNVAMIGFLGVHRHFDGGVPRANLADLVHLAKTLVVYSLIAQDEDWRSQYLA